MKFNRYLEKILGSKVKIGIVRTLLKHPARVYSGRELSRQIKGISHMAVFKSIKDLIDYNLVNVEHHGGVQLIKLNKKSYLYKPLKSLFYCEERSRNKLILYIKKLFEKNKEIEAIVLFGSIAKGIEKVDSDIDLLILARNKEKVNETIAENQKKIVDKFGNIFSAMILNRKEYKEKGQLEVIKNIKKEGILVFGKL